MADDRDSKKTKASDRTGAIAGAIGKEVGGLGKPLMDLVDEKDEGTKEDIKEAFAAGKQAADAVQSGAKAWSDTQKFVDAVGKGDAARATEAGFGAAAGSSGHLAGALGLIGDVTGDEGYTDAANVARVVQGVSALGESVTRHIGDAVRHFDEASKERSRPVEYELTIDGAEHEWKVREFTMTEGLSESYEVILRVRAEAPDVDLATELLGRNASLVIQRKDDHNRRVCGVIDRVAELGSRQHHTEMELRVVPAFALLRHGSDSRIFQEKNAVEIVEEVLEMAFAPYGREVDTSGIVATYAPREMCVQYRESHAAFVSRLLEEEGIGYYFDFDGEGHERMVLFDAQSQIPALTTMDGNAVPYAHGAQLVRETEPIVSFEAAHRLGPTHITVRDLNWTDSEYRAEATREGEDLRGWTRAVYHHGHGRAITLHDFKPGGRYEASDVERQAQIRWELMNRDPERYRGVSMLVGLRPGVIFELTDHPVPGLDGRYLLLSVRHRNSAPPHGGGSASEGERYHNEFECIRAFDTPYVPTRATPKPAIYGVQTAIVSGPSPGEPYTDEYGRIRVQFHWDREAIDPSKTSAWIRLAQTWAGHDSSGLHTFLFIPRVGSEVIVTFVDGDPDRPLVTGSVYNAQNLPPLALPDQATRSVIRTETVGGGDGHNELSFEDAAGKEEVYIRAQRDLRELVLNDHKTHVKRNHTNIVDGKDDETVGGDQWLRVKGSERHKWVENQEINEIGGMRNTYVAKVDKLTVQGDAIRIMKSNKSLDVWEDSKGHIKGKQTWTVGSGSELTVTGGITQTIKSGGWSMTTTGDVSHTIKGTSFTGASGNISVSSKSHMSMDAKGKMDLSAADITLTAQAAVTVVAPAGKKVLTPTQESHTSNVENKTTSQCLENVGVKLGMYNIAANAYAMKADYCGLKVDLFRFRFNNEDAHAALSKLELKSASGARISRALATLIG